MKSFRQSIAATLGALLPFLSVSAAWAQTATVNVGSQKQYIRGFGGMVHVSWQGGDMTAAERTLAFGNADGQLGFTVVRIPVTDGNPDAVNVPSAKAAIAASCTQRLGTPAAR